MVKGVAEGMGKDEEGRTGNPAERPSEVATIAAVRPAATKNRIDAVSPVPSNRARSAAPAWHGDKTIDIPKGGQIMPGRNGTGPQGLGPMTGWGAGSCGGQRETTNFGGGRGWQCGLGRGLQRGFGGRGRGRLAYAPGQQGWRRSAWDFAAAPGQEAQDLKAQAAALENELKLVNQRLAEVEDADKEE